MAAYRKMPVYSTLHAKTKNRHARKAFPVPNMQVKGKTKGEKKLPRRSQHRRQSPNWLHTEKCPSISFYMLKQTTNMCGKPMKVETRTTPVNPNIEASSKKALLFLWWPRSPLPFWALACMLGLTGCFFFSCQSQHTGQFQHSSTLSLLYWSFSSSFVSNLWCPGSLVCLFWLFPEQLRQF